MEVVKIRESGENVKSYLPLSNPNGDCMMRPSSIMLTADLPIDVPPPLYNRNAKNVPVFIQINERKGQFQSSQAIMYTCVFEVCGQLDSTISDKN